MEEQLERRGISDPRILEAMREIPRDAFVDEDLRDEAYSDRALPIGLDQTISQPYMVALMTERLDILPHDRILEIGTGSGYQTAILARLVRRVYTVERLVAFAGLAEERLRRLGLDNVEYRTGDGSLGWPEEAPFDGILVAAGAPELPDSLVSQLRLGSRLVIPVGPIGKQGLRVYEKVSDGECVLLETLPCAFVPLRGAEAWPESDS